MRLKGHLVQNPYDASFPSISTLELWVSGMVNWTHTFPATPPPQNLYNQNMSGNAGNHRKMPSIKVTFWKIWGWCNVDGMWVRKSWLVLTKSWFCTDLLRRKCTGFQKRVLETPKLRGSDSEQRSWASVQKQMKGHQELSWFSPHGMAVIPQHLWKVENLFLIWVEVKGWTGARPQVIWEWEEEGKGGGQKEG